MQNTYKKHVIFTDSQIDKFFINEYTKQKKLFIKFDGKLFDEECNIFYEFNQKLYISFFNEVFDGLKEYLENSEITDKKNVKYDKIYLYIDNIDKILPNSVDNYFRSLFFYMISNVKNNKLFFVMNNCYKEYFLSQIKLYKKYRKNIKSNAEVYKQILFVDDNYKRMKNKNVFFTELYGENCIDIENFFTEISTKCRFPSYFGRNFSAVNDCINDFSWLGAPYEIFMIHIKNIELILQKNKYERNVFFDIIKNLTNKRVFVLIDKIYKDFFK